MNNMALSPGEYLRTARFAPEEIDLKFPNARRILTEGVFVSHSGQDTRRVYDEIVIPVLHERFADGIFFHNRGSGGSESYKQLVQAALHFCDKFIVAVSCNSINNLWVRAEADWAAEHRRPIIHCLLDESEPHLLYSAPTPLVVSPNSIDFRSDIGAAQKRLRLMIDDLLVQYPYRRLIHF
jgi:TIR domain